MTDENPVLTQGEIRELSYIATMVAVHQVARGGQRCSGFYTAQHGWDREIRAHWCAAPGKIHLSWGPRREDGTPETS